MSSFPTDTFTAADLASFIPALWGQKVNDFFKSKLTMASFFVNRSDELADGGNIVYTPDFTEMAASAKSNGTAVNTMAALTFQLI